MSLYDELGVPRDADTDAIRKAYRKKAQKEHPDKGGDAAKFHQIQRAYDVLTDAERRSKYDSTGETQNAPSLQEQATSLLAGMLQQILANVDTDYVDIVEMMRQKAKDGIRQVKDETRAAREKIKKRKATLTRFKRKGQGENLFARFLQFDIRSLENGIANLENTLAVGEEMLRILADYEYSAEKPGAGVRPYAGLTSMFRQQ